MHKSELEGMTLPELTALAKKLGAELSEDQTTLIYNILDAQSLQASIEPAAKKRGRKPKAKDEAEAEKLLSDAKALEEAGCFALGLEKIPAALTQKVCQSLQIPVIGIGGGPADGQVLVVHDMLGMNKGFSPKFLRRYAELFDVMTDAIGQYITDVKSGDFPNENEKY